MKKHLIFVFFCLFAVSVKAQSFCTEADLRFKEYQFLHFRKPALIGQKKFISYIQISKPKMARFSTLRAEYEKNKEQGQVHLDQMCLIMDQIAIVTDDLLAGGDGLGQKKPWKKQNPESLFKAIEEFKKYCATTASCQTAQAEEIMDKLILMDKLLFYGNDPVELIDEYHNAIQNFLYGRHYRL